MFEEIDTIDWPKLSHSHGKAEEVPLKLSALIGLSEEGRNEALAYFWEFMLHQGSRYEASRYVVRFLFEVLEDAKCPIQRNLIDLLLGLGVGYGESFLPYGYDLEEEEQRFQEKSWNGLFGYDDARSAYYEVHQRASTFANFLRPEFDPEIRLSAGFAVAHFAQPLSTLHREVAEYIKAETDEEQLQSLILCFGMLGRFADVQPEVRILLPYLDNAGSQTLKVAASIGMMTILGARAPNSVLQTVFGTKAIYSGMRHLPCD